MVTHTFSPQHIGGRGCWVSKANQDSLFQKKSKKDLVQVKLRSYFSVKLVSLYYPIPSDKQFNKQTRKAHLILQTCLLQEGGWLGPPVWCHPCGCRTVLLC